MAKSQRRMATSGNMQTKFFRTMFIPGQPENEKPMTIQRSLFDGLE